MATCSCDSYILNDCLNISPGLKELPRQYMTFNDYRSAMLSDIASKPALKDWSGEVEHDLGVMLLDMWSYVLDVTQFYDEKISEEAYVRTAKRDISTNRIVEILGYKRKPALSAKVNLSLEIDGHDDTTLAAGIRFRSEAFDDQPPQVFELISDVTVSPQFNKWQIVDIPDTKFPGRLLVKPKGSGVPRSGILTVVETSSPSQVWGGYIESIDAYTAADNTKYQEVTLSPDISSDLSDKDVTNLRMFVMGLSAHQSPYDDSTSSFKVYLDGVYPQLVADQPAVFEVNGTLYPFMIVSVSKENVATGITDIEVPVTRIEYPSSLGANLSSGFTLHFNPISVGKLSGLNKERISLNDINEVSLEKPSVELVDSSLSANFMLIGQSKLGKELSGTVSRNSFSDYSFSASMNATEFEQDLKVPVSLRGNIVTAYRGESVKQEVLGSTDSSTPNNRYKLKKQPLSWIEDSSSALGARPLLDLYVNGVRWQRVNSLFTAKPNDRVYVIESDELGDSWVRFGDGIRGERPSSGVNNIVADYYFGAGAAKPPPGSIHSIAKGAKQLKAVYGATRAQGGRDIESSESVKTHASSSVLTLGRAVSIHDFDALAKSYTGVLGVSSGWAWDPGKQRAVVKIWIIDDGGIDYKTMRNWLSAMATPGTPIVVSEATGLERNLTINISYDLKVPKEITREAITQLLHDKDSGLLSKNHIGIHKVLYRSDLVKNLQELDGVDGVTSIRFQGSEMEWAIQAPIGHYFNFSDSTTVN
ncbi:MAG TPA: hypothetical protein VIM93_07150 [Kangiella sp.]